MTNLEIGWPFCCAAFSKPVRQLGAELDPWEHSEHWHSQWTLFWASFPKGAEKTDVKSSHRSRVCVFFCVRRWQSDDIQPSAQAVDSGILDLYGSECGEGTYFVFVVQISSRFWWWDCDRRMTGGLESWLRGPIEWWSIIPKLTEVLSEKFQLLQNAWKSCSTVMNEIIQLVKELSILLVRCPPPHTA